MVNAEEVVRTYADMVYKIAYRYAGNTADAEDIYSEVFLSYFRRERSFESEEHRKAWLIRVTINCAKELLSSRSPYLELEEERVSEEDTTTTEEILDLHRAIDRLPLMQKEVITLFYLQDLPIRQVADILGKSENAVKVALSRARDRLRQFLED